jgi:hypothetical protein
VEVLGAWLPSPVHAKRNFNRTGARFPKFAPGLHNTFCELREAKGTSKLVDSSTAFDLKSLK